MKKIIFIYFILLSPFAYAYDEWDKNTTYHAGDMVKKDGVIYVSTHWNKKSPPANNKNNWDGWITFPNNKPEWDASTSYHGGDVVAYQGKFYLSKYWNHGTTPHNNAPWLILIGADKPTPPTEPDPTLDPESKAAILGIDSNNNGLDDEYEAKIEQTYSNEKDKELAKALGISWRITTEFYFIDQELIDKKTAERAIITSSSLYSCSQDKIYKNNGYIPPNNLYFSSIHRSFSYRMAQSKLANIIDMNKNHIDNRSCAEFEEK
ncbi:hypothetical protein HC723_08225 [Vibrio sp. S11_S32]|uniref:carbohydrate-binding protein n=1 Tax=Vibrio sp. S11_S32 TaxID=2720225 RepID=UPI0016811352|nr:carbohydrate-binding protein [Vibrio sp. S11_S32]MBD1576422.1 hypothetical protein [Vibrio sp. S11_S32]